MGVWKELGGSVYWHDRDGATTMQWFHGNMDNHVRSAHLWVIHESEFVWCPRNWMAA